MDHDAQCGLRDPYCVENSLAEFNKNENQIFEAAQNDIGAAQSLTTSELAREVEGGGVGREKGDDFAQYLTHPVLISSYAWSPSSPSSVSLVHDDVLSLYAASASPMMKGKLEGFLRFRATLRLTFVVQGSPQMAGTLVYTCYPTSRPTLASSIYVNRATVVNSRISPHVVIDPSQSKTYTLDLPVNSPTGWYSLTETPGGSWNLVRTIFNPLFSGTAVANNIAVRVYMSLVNPEFEGLTATPLSGYLELKNVEKDVESSSLPLIPPGALSSGLTMVRKVAEVTADTLKRLGFSRPQQAEVSALAQVRTHSHWSHVDGLSTDYVLGRSQGQRVGEKLGEYGGLDGDMSVDSIVSKAGYVGNREINVSNVPGDLLGEYLVSPSSTIADTPTPLYGVGIAARFWRGDITYVFEFVASVFHRTTVLIAWDPVGDSPPTYDVALTTLANVTVEISGNTTVEIDIPWRQWEFAKGFSESNGHVFVYLVNPLTSNGSESPIQMNAFISSNNIAFFCPTTPLKYYAVGLSRSLVKKVSLGNRTDLNDSELIFSGDRLRNLKEFVTRQTGTNDILLTTNATNFTSGYAIIPTIDLGDDFNMLSYFAPAFMGYRGGIRETLITSEMPEKTTVEYFLSFFNGNTDNLTGPTSVETSPGFYALGASNLFVQSCVEYTMPYLFPFFYVPAWQRFLTAPRLPAVVTKYKSDPPISVRRMRGGGDDFAFIRFTGFPAYNSNPS